MTGRTLLLGFLIVVPAAAAQIGDPSTLFTSASASAPPRIEFQESTVVANGMTPGGRVVWFSLWRKRVDRAWTDVRRQQGIVRDTDEDGVVEIVMEEPVPPLSVWVLADVTSSEVLVAVPERFRIRELALDRQELKQGARSLLIKSRRLELLWLRPDVGIWYQRIRDGGEGDDDLETYAHVRAALDRFTPRFPASRPPPDKIKNGDIFVAVDTRSLRVFLVRVEP